MVHRRDLDVPEDGDIGVPVSRFFVDARVLSIFEGAEEVLALKVTARRLVRS